jgi:hypothetical protein
MTRRDLGRISTNYVVPAKPLSHVSHAVPRSRGTPPDLRKCTLVPLSHAISCPKIIQSASDLRECACPTRPPLTGVCVLGTHAHTATPWGAAAARAALHAARKDTT